MLEQKIHTFLQTVIPCFVHHRQGKHRPCFTSLYPLKGLENQNMFLFIERKTEGGVKTNFTSSPHLYSPFWLLSTSNQCCPLVSSSLTLSFWPFCGHCPLSFVHNVGLFIFHSCLLPCFFIFCSPFFFSKDVYWNISGPFWNAFVMCCFGPFLIRYNCLKQILFLILPVCF